MISLTSPEEQVTGFNYTHEQIMDTYAAWVEMRFTAALVEKFGEMPSHDEIRDHCVRYLDKEGVSHFVWYEGEKPGIGEKPDLTQAFLSLEPPKFGGAS